jgi:hypothetical protein
MAIDLRAAHRLPHSGALFDASFPGASYEDIELCVCNAAAGVPMALAHRARVRHEFILGGAGAGADADASGGGTAALFARFVRYGASELLLFDKQRHVSYKTLYADTRPLRVLHRRGGQARGGGVK